MVGVPLRHGHFNCVVGLLISSSEMRLVTEGRMKVLRFRDHTTHDDCQSLFARLLLLENVVAARPRVRANNWANAIGDLQTRVRACDGPPNQLWLRAALACSHT
jgi:hypothetical protein